MKRSSSFMIIAIALTVSGCGSLFHRTEESEVFTTPQAPSPVEKKVEKKETEPLHILGNPNAPVTLEEFGDYECPPCGKISTVLDQLVKEYNPRLRLVFRNFPNEFHKHARDAALAAEAAGLQGRFWEMHDFLYGEQVAWSKAADPTTLFEDYAVKLGLNLEQFRRDVQKESVKTRVESDRMHAQTKGVKATPTLFLNDQKVAPRDHNLDGLRAAIDAALKGSTATSSTQ